MPSSSNNLQGDAIKIISIDGDKFQLNHDALHSVLDKVPESMPVSGKSYVFYGSKGIVHRYFVACTHIMLRLVIIYNIHFKSYQRSCYRVK